MAKKAKVKEINNSKTIKANGNKWQIASASLEADLILLLEDDFEPYAVSNGVHYLKKKDN